MCRQDGEINGRQILRQSFFNFLFIAGVIDRLLDFQPELPIAARGPARLWPERGGGPRIFHVAAGAVRWWWSVHWLPSPCGRFQRNDSGPRAPPHCPPAAGRTRKPTTCGPAAADG